MKILCAPDSFKGSLSAFQAATILQEAMREVFPNAIVTSIPLADGGEGTCDILVQAYSGCKIDVFTVDALGRERIASYGELDHDTAVVETAAAIGLPLLEKTERDPFRTSSWGAGILLRHAFLQGYHTLYVTLGGSATNDGGLGALAALGVRFLDQYGQDLPPVVSSLHLIQDVDLQSLPTKTNTRMLVLCDVDNPLLGPNGATMVYSRQKGASPEQQVALEMALAHYADILEKKLGRAVREFRGAGAAGGLGAALAAVFGAELHSGADAILKILNVEQAVIDADLVITGEGCLDGQTASGKVIHGLGQLCKKNKRPLIAVVGALDASLEQYRHLGVTIAVPIGEQPQTIAEAMKNAPVLLKRAAIRTAELLRIGGYIMV